MLSAKTKTSDLVVLGCFGLFCTRSLPPSNSVTIYYAYLLIKPGWGCKVGAGAVLVLFQSALQPRCWLRFGDKSLRADASWILRSNF